MRLTDIDIKFYYRDKEDDDSIIEGRLSSSAGWQQWGQPKEKLGENVKLIEKLQAVAEEYFNTNEENEEK